MCNAAQFGFQPFQNAFTMTIIIFFHILSGIDISQVIGLKSSYL